LKKSQKEKKNDQKINSKGQSGCHRVTASTQRDGCLS
jgi:hypothetical protein